MNPYQRLYPQLNQLGLTDWSSQLQQLIAQRLSPEGGHGKMMTWLNALNALPDISPSFIDIKQGVNIGESKDLASVDSDQFITNLQVFHPWRKGPYSLFGIAIDTEWRSDWKWDRVLPHIRSLAGRKVLDIGAGNGYHGWRMLGEDAELVIGIDPTLVFVIQYHVISHYMGQANHYVLPLGIEELPAGLACFDTVFSMGVLYHRRSPIDHLYQLRACLHPGGELVLETLVIDGDPGTVLVPEDRYAKMANVWFIPTIATMELWLRRGGFKQVRCVDTNMTSIDEQRATQWMHFESLSDFLDPDDQRKTIEGYPAPKRAIFIAQAPK